MVNAGREEQETSHAKTAKPDENTRVSPLLSLDAPRPRHERLEAKAHGNKFKPNADLIIKLARAVSYILNGQTVFDPQRLIRLRTRTAARLHGAHWSPSG